MDAIVNAANVALAPGGGVCGAIHRAAGPELADACEDEAPCPTGEARITSGFALRARWVVHVVGPVWRGGGFDEDRLLGSCYRHALELAAANGARSVAFPAIGTGIYAFPLERATAIALRTIAETLAAIPAVERVICACFDARTLECYQAERARLGW